MKVHSCVHSDIYLGAIGCLFRCRSWCFCADHGFGPRGWSDLSIHSAIEKAKASRFHNCNFHSYCASPHIDGVDIPHASHEVHVRTSRKNQVLHLM